MNRRIGIRSALSTMPVVSRALVFLLRCRLQAQAFKMPVDRLKAPGTAGLTTAKACGESTKVNMAFGFVIQIAGVFSAMAVFPDHDGNPQALIVPGNGHACS